jgi:hypothetical protein
VLYKTLFESREKLLVNHRSSPVSHEGVYHKSPEIDVV